MIAADGRTKNFFYATMLPSRIEFDDFAVVKMLNVRVSARRTFQVLNVSVYDVLTEHIQVKIVLTG